MNLFRSFRRPSAPTKHASAEDALIGWALHANGRVEAIKQGSGAYGSGFGEGAFSETAFGVNVALSQSVFGWAAAYSVSTWVYRCIEVRKAAIHRMPWGVYDKRTKAKLTDHPLYIALKRNPQKLFKKIEQSQLLYGESFIELAQNDFGYRSDLYWFNNLGMAVLVGGGRIVGYSYTALQGGTPKTLEPDEVAFMKTDNPFNDLRGMSPLEVAMDEVAIDKDVARVVRAYYANDTRVGLLLIPKQNLLPADNERFMESWKLQHQGPSKAGKPALMPFDLSVERTQEPATLDDVQLRESTRREICAVFGVPLSLAGAWDDAKYQSLPEQRKSFYEETVLPQCENIAEFINTDILPHFDDAGTAEFKFDFTAILALTEDAQKKNDIYSNRLISGLITRAEARQALGHPVRDVDDVYYIPAGSTVVSADEEALVTPTANVVDNTPQQQDQAALSTPPTPRPAVTPAPDKPQLPVPQPAPKQLPAQAAPHKAIAAPQATPLEELAAWEKKALNTNALKAAGFTCYVLPTATQVTVRNALKAAGKDANKAAIRAIFTVARKAITPPAALDYWRHYDALMEQIGSAWLDEYMAAALAALLPADATDPASVQAALDSAHPTFEAALLGDADTPGPLVKLIIAGMGAGQEAIYHGSAANPQRPVSGKAELQIDWTLLAREARDFARQYLYDLIRNVDETTRQQVQQAVTQWLESGQSLDELKQSLQTIFNDPVRAQRIAVTETTRAYAEGSMERYRRSDIKTVRWMAANDSHVCPICQDLVGTTAPIDAGFKTAKGNVTPPAHVGCRCYIRPVVED